MSTIDSRRSVRRWVRILGEIVRAKDFKLLASRIVDVSEGGVRVVTDARVLTGERVFVSFRLPGSDDFIDAEATVAYVHHEGPARALGLEFVDLDDDTRTQLLARLPKIPPVVPRQSGTFSQVVENENDVAESCA